MLRYLLAIFFLSIASAVSAQGLKIYGRITTSKLEPIAFVSVQLKELRTGTVTKEDGTFELYVEGGQYNLVVSMIGYKTRQLGIVVEKDYQQNIILEEDDSHLEEVIVKAKVRDRAEEVVRSVIQNKEKIQATAGAYSAKVYIKAVQQDSLTRKNKNQKNSNVLTGDEDLNGMAMTEISLKMDFESANRTKEERYGVKKIGDPSRLFYLTTTDGIFNFYDNLIKVPAISATPFLSPISYSGLIAYKFKTIKIERIGGHKIYTISVKPRQMSNATVDGEIVVMDSAFVLMETHFTFPKYHLPEYDYFQIDQQYSYVQNKSWLLSRQEFTYYSKSNRQRLSGHTVATFSDYELNKQFAKRYFGPEVSATAQSAYQKDSLFWQTVRTEPLTPKEIRFIQYRDSMYRVSHTKDYLDSVDRYINKITWKKMGFTGQSFYNREKERTWHLPPAVSLIEPFAFGGPRLRGYFFYSKIYPSRKNLSLYSSLSYGLRNNDVNGNFHLVRTYNPFNRGFYRVTAGRDFKFIFEGDAYINLIKRNNYYLNNYFGIGQGLELVNGLFLFTDIDITLRRSVSKYKTGSLIDSVFIQKPDQNRAVAFDPYNAVYGKVRLQYTPKQRYLREPKEKVILGSVWPTFYVTLRKGLPSILNSQVNFDYLELGMEQQLNLGLLGNTRYTVKTGSFINQRKLQLIDYQFQRKGDPFLYMNPDEAFQSLDSTFPLFKRFYQGHLVHELNGALLNKIPLLKKLQLREVAGAGFLLAPERYLRYAEVFTGVERVFKWPFNPLTKFKIGAYVVGSVANKFSNPIRFKVGLTTWDIERNKWH